MDYSPTIYDRLFPPQTTMMRAVLVKDGSGPAENLYIGEVPKPQIASRQILVKVRGILAVSLRRLKRQRLG